MESRYSAIHSTLLWSLLRGGSSPAAPFLQDYASRGTNALLWICLISVTALLARKLVLLLRLWVIGSRIPGPPAPSLFGLSKLVSGAGSGVNLIGCLAKLHEKHGPIVRLWLGPTQLLVSVKDVGMIEEVLEKAEDRLPLTGRAFRLAFGRSGLFGSSFVKVQKRREALAAHLNGKLLKKASAIPLKVVECVVGRTDSIIAKGILDSKSISQHMAFSLFGAILFGDAFLTWSNATVYEKLLMLIAKDACFWASYNVPPVWRRGFWRYQSLCKEVKQLTLDIIQHCKSNCNPVDLVDCQLYSVVHASNLLEDRRLNKLVLENIEGHLLSAEELCGDVVCLMYHACLTTASLIWSILTRLALYPEIQESIYMEINKMHKETSNSALYDVKKMNLLLATVYESARLLPAGTLLQRCFLEHDLSLKKTIIIPAGAIVVVPQHLVHLDNSVWGKDACLFNPHRFLSKDLHQEHFFTGEEHDLLSGNSSKGKSDDSHDSGDTPFRFSRANNNAVFLPFGGGSRECIGQELSLIGISTFFATLLKEYQVKVQAGSENEPKPTLDDYIPQLLPNPKFLTAPVLLPILFLRVGKHIRAVISMELASGC